MVVDRTLSKWYDNTCKEEILESDFGGSVGGLERRDEKQETQQREEKNMKWVKEDYGYAHEGYHQYRCGDYVIRQTHSKNIFTGKEMSWANQVWEIFKNGEKIDYCGTFADAKKAVAKMEGR